MNHGKRRRDGPESGLDVVMLAGRWTLLDGRGAVADGVRRSGRRRRGAAPFNSGLLARNRPLAGAPFDTSPPEDVLERARELADICGSRTHVRGAIQFPLGRRAVVSVVVGPGSPDEWRRQSAVRRRPSPTRLGRAGCEAGCPTSSSNRPQEDGGSTMRALRWVRREPARQDEPPGAIGLAHCRRSALGTISIDECDDAAAESTTRHPAPVRPHRVTPARRRRPAQRI